MESGGWNSEQKKLYELIWNKFISSQMAPAVIDQTTIIFEAAGHYFKSNGSIIKFPGFLNSAIRYKIPYHVYYYINKAIYR